MRKPILSLTLALTLPGFGQITADFAISEGGSPLGTLTLELDHLNAPMATANFIGLITGELAWVDSTTGAVRTNTPYYDGIKIHRTDQGFVSQFGSQKGDGSDGPGYRFPDQPDLSSSLSHDGPYVLSMANSGPNTNGSQVFITAAATPFLDPKHIILGRVATGSSRTLADYINSVPVVDADGPDDIPGNGDDDNTPVTDLIITSATVDMNGVNFDIHAQDLPVVSGADFDAVPGPNETEAALTQEPGTRTQVITSEDLLTWTFTQDQYLDHDSTTLLTYPLPSSATAQDRGFFRRFLVSYQSSVLWPTSLGDRTLVTLTAVDPIYPFTFEFDANGVTGTWSYSNPDNPLSGDILDSFNGPDGYGCRLIMILSGINFNRWDFRRIGFDSTSPTLLDCRHTGLATITTNPFANPLTLDGNSTLTR